MAALNLDEFAAGVVATADINELVDLVVNQGRPPRFIKPTDEQCRTHLLKVRVILRKLKATSSLAAVAQGLRVRYPDIACKSDVGVIFNGFYDYTDHGFMFTRDKAVLAFLDFHHIDDVDADEFIRSSGGLHQCYLKMIAFRKGGEPVERRARSKSLRLPRPDDLNADGDIMLGVIHLSDSHTGKAKFSHAMKVTKNQGEEFIRELAILVQRYMGGAPPSGNPPKSGTITLFNKVGRRLGAGKPTGTHAQAGTAGA